MRRFIGKRLAKQLTDAYLSIGLIGRKTTHGWLTVRDTEEP